MNRYKLTLNIEYATNAESKQEAVIKFMEWMKESETESIYAGKYDFFRLNKVINSKRLPF